jgi:DNA-binding CsgD family transcriptional regulator
VVESVADAGMRRYRLSPRQRQVAWLILAGRTNAEIAEALYITERTVKNQVTLMTRRIGMENTRGSVRAAIIARLLRIEGVAERGLRECTEWVEQTGAERWRD